MLRSLIEIKELLTILLNRVLIITVLLLVLDVTWGVATRTVTGGQANWTEELARFLLVWVSLLGAAVAFGTKAHLGVDYLVNKMHPEVHRLTAVITHCIVLFFAGAVFIYGGGRLVADALAMNQLTPALQWKMGYVYLALPVAGFFIIIFALENLLETIAAEPNEPADKPKAGDILQ